jgi:hypothetical protein
MCILLTFKEKDEQGMDIGRGEGTEVGKVTLKSNGDEALSNESH